jgi:hypothetical protein
MLQYFHTRIAFIHIERERERAMKEYIEGCINISVLYAFTIIFLELTNAQETFHDLFSLHSNQNGIYLMINHADNE